MNGAPILPPQARILAVKLADIGDVLLCTPALRALRARYPRARIDLLTPPGSARVLEGAPEIDTVLVFDKFPFDTLASLTDAREWRRAAQFLADLHRRRYDAVVVFHHFSLRFGALKFAALTLATGAPRRVGLDNGRGWFLTSREPDAGFGACHEAVYWLRLAARLGADPAPDNKGLTLPRNAADEAFVTAWLADRAIDSARPLIAVHPGAGWYSPARRWPPGAFARLLAGLISQFQTTIILVGGPDEVELAAGIRARLPPAQQAAVHIAAGQTSVRQTAALLGRCDLFIGNDSGPLHLATAAGIPAIGIYGLSNWRAFGPIGRGPAPAGHAWGTTPEWIAGDPEARPPADRLAAPHATLVIRRALPCQPCLYRGQDLGLRGGCGTRECLTALPPTVVLDAAARMLAAVQRPATPGIIS